MNPRQIEIVDREMAAVLATMTARERLQIASGMWKSASRMLTRLTAANHQDWDDQAIANEVARRMTHGTD